MDLVAIGGAAAVCAGFFTNPLDVVKTRMQLQGEMEKRGTHKHFKNVFHATYVIGKQEGVLALQKGLMPALWQQFFLNGIRLGSYQFLDNKGLLVDNVGNLSVSRSMAASGVTGMLGAYLSSPFYLIKTHIQAQASSGLAYGHQHKHHGMISGFQNIFKQEGFKGFFRGSSSSLPRALVGSIAQLSSFSYCKDFMRKKEILQDSKLLAAFTASMVGGIVLALAMTPFDLVSTRLYNQGVGPDGKGLLYKNYMDCVWKVYKIEGFFGFYKGLGASYFRLGPHSVLNLVFWEQFKELYKNMQNSRFLK